MVWKSDKMLYWHRSPWHFTKVCVVLSLTVGSGCRQELHQNADDSRRPIQVVVDVVRELEEYRKFQVWGRVDPPRQLQFRAPSNLTLLQIRPAGANVKKGELLAQFDVTTLNRQQGLLQNQILNTSVESERQRLQVQLNEINRQIIASTIRAPFNLIVRNSYATANSRVDVDRAILDVVEYGQPRISMRVPGWIEETASSGDLSITINDQDALCAFEFERDANDSFSSRKLTLVVQSSELPPGVDQFFNSVSVRFEHPYDSGAFRIPVSALSTDSNGQWQILVVATEQQNERSLSVVTQKPVEIFNLNESSAVITGVEPGIWFVLNGQHRLVEGEAVEMESVAALSGEDSSLGFGPE